MVEPDTDPLVLERMEERAVLPVNLAAISVMETDQDLGNILINMNQK